MGPRHPDHNLNSPGFRSEGEWETLTTSERIDYLRPEDYATVSGMFQGERRAARAKVLAEWLAVHGDLRDHDAFLGWKAARSEAIVLAEQDLWAAFEGQQIEGRCRHGASIGRCHVRDCVHQWGLPKPTAPGSGGFGSGWPPERDWRVDTKL